MNLPIGKKLYQVSLKYIRVILLVMIPGLLSSYNIYPSPTIKCWDSMSVEEQDAAISRLPHNSVVAQYIDRQFSISDDEQTERLLNELVSNTHDGPRNALYLHLFTEICLNADGAVGEIIGRYCMIILINNPQYINILKSDGSMMDIYAQNIAEELYYDPHSELYARLLFELNQMSEDDFVLKINHYLDNIN